MRHLLLFALVSVLLTSCTKERVTKVDLPEGYFENDWPSVLNSAQEHDKNIFVHLYANWCIHCAEFKADVLNEAEVETYMFDHFIGAEMDAEMGKGIELVADHNLSGHPHMAVFDKDENLLSSHLGKMTKAEFLGWIADYE